VSEHDVRLLLTEHDLISIGMMADDVRRQMHGTAATFVRVFELHADGLPDALPAGTSAGELRIAGRPTDLDSACAAVAKVRALAEAAVVTGFSLSDVTALGGDASAVCRRLKHAGLDGLAEVPLDDRPQAGDVAAARAAGLLVERLTVITAPADPVALLQRAQALIAAVAGFRAFAPLPRAISVASPTTGYDDVRMVAAARILLRDVPSIQVDWPLYGPKLAQVALTFGADDVDGVAAVEPGSLGTRRSAIEEIRRNIRAAGFEPVERDGRFARRPASDDAAPAGRRG
jgi:aminodeoxyfutalosine synthase